MDPNAVLDKMLELALTLRADADAHDDRRAGFPEKVMNEADLADTAYELADRVQALHLWLSEGGFYPRAWA